MFKGFRDFLLRGNVVDLAVAVVIGAAFSKIVTALVDNLITPLIGALGGTPDFSNLTFTINNSQFMIGAFVNACINFIIVAGIIYFFVIMPMNKVMAKVKRGQSPDPLEKTCPHCISQIPLNATRCKFCTSIIK